MLFSPKKNDLKQYQSLLNPKISEKADQNMLVVEAIGEPGAVAGKAFKLLYSTYYKLKGVPKSYKPAAPRSRWMFAEDTPPEQWVGLVGLALPDDIISLPEVKNPDSLKISIAKWQYGTVAEILHIGPYDREEPTVQRLMDYITEQGYTIIGEHEEEYIRGPGMFGKGKPDKYLTIIRYRVEKISQ